MPVDTLIGQVMVDRYEIKELIGESDMARVYHGLDQRLSRSVVVKRLRAEVASKAEALQRFERAASSEARLSHPHIARVYDVLTHEGVPVIIREFEAGETLKELLLRQGRLSVERTLDIALPVVEALDYAHQQGMLHGDIKPGNILIGERGDVKVTDFGQVMSGSAHYFSPEQAQGQPVGSASDLYSLGVVLYEMLCGHTPFEGDNPVTVGLKHVQEAPPKLQTHGVSVPPALEDAIMTALQKNPRDRFPDAAAFAGALRRALRPSSQATSATTAPAPPPAPIPKAAARTSQPTLQSARSSLSQLTSGEMLPPSPPKMVRRSRRRQWLLLVLVAAVAAGGLYVLGLFVTQHVTVPDLKGVPEDAARIELEKSGIHLSVGEMQYNDQLQPGTIMAQAPAPGAHLHPGEQVTVILSKGKQTVPVPTVVGMDRAEARKALEDRGFLADWDEQPSDEVALGKVISQEPRGGSIADLRSSVRVVISKGPPPIVVPDLIGKTEADAAQMVSKKNLLLTSTTTRPSATVAKGTVLEQKPAKGTKVPKGTKIQIVLSSGPEAQSVPLLKGLSLRQAHEKAESQGFQLIVDGPGGDNGDMVVADQSPGGGDLLSRGGTIHVTVEPEASPEQSEDMVTVPSLVNMQEQEARAAAEDRGLRISTVPSAEAVDQPPGTVLSQVPAEGTQVKRGTVINIVVAGPQ
jgi:serine/threonine-protein kinase